VTHRGPFQPQTFCDSVRLLGSAAEGGVDFLTFNESVPKLGLHGFIDMGKLLCDQKRKGCKLSSVLKLGHGKSLLFLSLNNIFF